MNINLLGFFGAFKVLIRPSLFVPHHTVSTFNDLPVPLDGPLRKQGLDADIRAVVLDKDDCFASPGTTEIHKPYQHKFAALRATYPGRRLLVVSNTAGAVPWDGDDALARAVEEAAGGVAVLRHVRRKPGCGDEIMEYFRQHPETGVRSPAQVAVVGDRLATDVVLANGMGSWAFWVRDGVVPLGEKSTFARWERRLAPFLLARGAQPPIPIPGPRYP